MSPLISMKNLQKQHNLYSEHSNVFSKISLLGEIKQVVYSKVHGCLYEKRERGKRHLIALSLGHFSVPKKALPKMIYRYKNITYLDFQNFMELSKFGQ